jgi:hypothetical protein
MQKVTRRFALAAGATGLAAASSLPRAVGASTVTVQPLKAVVTIGGIRYEYKEEQGQNLGDFVSTIGNFTQGCVRCELPGSPLTVFFRPDRTSDRAEVVFELGRVHSGTPAHLGAYTVTISRGITVLTTVDVPAHYWHSRWRWQSAPRPIVGSVPTLISQNLLPPFDVEGALASVAATPSTTTTTTATLEDGSVVSCTTQAPPTQTPVQDGATSVAAVPYTIMGVAGLTAYMPQTGERADIGIVTEAQAEYICTYRQTALDRLRAQAEAAGTAPWHFRDENTSAPLDLKAYPGATWYSSTTTGKPYVKTLKSTITVDSAHQPALAYVPYVLTGDPYHLEDLQFQANWNIGTLVPAYRFTIPQTRSFAWSLRSLAQAAKVTPANVPKWLLPQSYWTSFLTDYRNFFEDQFVNNPSPERAIFRATRNVNTSGDEGAKAPKGTWIDPWEDEFLVTIFGWIVAMGFRDWQTSFDWKVGSTLARTSTSSGWIRAHSTPYRLILRATATSPYANNWQEAWALQQRINLATYSDPNTWVTTDMTYLTYTRAALVYAQKLGTFDVTEKLNWATQQLKSKSWKTPYKWRLGTGL